MVSNKYKEPTINRLIRNYYDSSERAHVRFGQWFVNNYIEEFWSDLYHEENDCKAITMVAQWLIDNCYEARMPKKINQPS